MTQFPEDDETGANIEGKFHSSFFPSNDSLANSKGINYFCLEKGKYTLGIYNADGENGVESYYIKSNGGTIGQDGQLNLPHETVFNIPFVP